VVTPYKELFDGVITKLKGSGIPGITEEDLDDILSDYVKPACVKFKACKQNLKERDDLLGFFKMDLTDEESEILINFMYIEFLSANYINVPSLLRQSLVSRDYHAFSSANHLKGLMGLRDMVKKETKQMISAYSTEGSNVLSKLKKMKQEAIASPDEDDDNEEY
jgi:hypothetical protein